MCEYSTTNFFSHQSIAWLVSRASAVSKRLGAKPLVVTKVDGQRLDTKSSRTAMDVLYPNMPYNNGNVDKKNRSLALIAAELISFHQ